MGQEEEAVLVPPAAAVVFSWEPVVKATAAVPEARRDVSPPGSPKKKQAPQQPPARQLSAPPGSPKKKAPHQQPPARRLSVPPPPGRASAPARATRSLSSRARAVRPEDDPFLAAYLACTKSRGGGKDAGGGAARGEEAKGRRRFTWSGLRLSCKSSAGAVEQSMVKVAKRPEPNPAGDD